MIDAFKPAPMRVWFVTCGVIVLVLMCLGVYGLTVPGGFNKIMDFMAT